MRPHVATKAFGELRAGGHSPVPVRADAGEKQDCAVRAVCWKARASSLLKPCVRERARQQQRRRVRSGCSAPPQAFAWRWPLSKRMLSVRRWGAVAGRPFWAGAIATLSLAHAGLASCRLGGVGSVASLNLPMRAGGKYASNEVNVEEVKKLTVLYVWRQIRVFLIAVILCCCD